jgi:hypothetical protein
MNDIFELDLNYLGKTESVTCHQNDVTFIMDIQPLEAWRSKDLRSARTTQDGSVILKYKNKREIILDKKTDLIAIGENYSLANCALTPDELFAGCSISHSAYWHLFRKNYIRSITYTYYHLTDNKQKAREWIKQALDGFDQRIFEQYGVDLKEEYVISKEDSSLLKGMESIAAHAISNMRN